MRIRSSTYTMVGVGLSLVVIVYVAEHLNWSLARDRLTTANPGWLAAGLGVFAINYLLRTVRFRVLLSSPHLAIHRLLGVMMLYGMFNYLMPTKSGEVSYVLLSHRYLDTSISEGAATLIAARFFRLWDHCPGATGGAGCLFRASACLASRHVAWVLCHRARIGDRSGQVP